MATQPHDYPPPTTESSGLISGPEESAGVSNTTSSESEEELELKVHRALRGKEATIVVVGQAGAGKSTLVNTLLLKPLRRTALSAKAVTAGLNEEFKEIDLRTGGTCTLRIIDTEGGTGRPSRDEQLKERLKKIKDIDLLLVCFDLSANGSRYNANQHYHVLNWFRPIFGERVMKKRCVIVLTKANTILDEPGLASSTPSTEPKLSSIKTLVCEWKQEHRETINEFGADGQCLLDIPVKVAGMVHFDEETKKPCSRSKIDKSMGWHDDLWNCVGERSGKKMAALNYIQAAKTRKDPEERFANNAPIARQQVINRVKDYVTSVLLAGTGAALVVFGGVLAATGVGAPVGAAIGTAGAGLVVAGGVHALKQS